jgi:predicted  nucleic acid-binding Zn-ribbon protein
VSRKRCQDCKTEYQQDAKHSGRCPNCGSSYFTLAAHIEGPTAANRTDSKEEFTPGSPQHSTKSGSRSDQVVGTADIENLITTQNKNALTLIAAQNKTTHAVRSLAITVVAAPIISIAIILAVFLASASGNTSLVVFTGILGVIVLIATMVVSLNELAKSKVY